MTYEDLEIKGQTIIDIVRDGNTELIFKTKEGNTYKMYHYQDCCESVTIDDICGDLNDLLNYPLLMAEVASKDGDDNDDWGTSTWTFYKLGTIKGCVTIRWYGESNGYYSESVDFDKINN